jgi:hypothetical protein
LTVDILTAVIYRINARPSEISFALCLRGIAWVEMEQRKKEMSPSVQPDEAESARGFEDCKEGLDRFSRALPRTSAKSFNKLGDTAVCYISFPCPKALTQHKTQILFFVEISRRGAYSHPYLPRCALVSFHT